MKRRRALTEEDNLLWRKVSSTVRPMHPYSPQPETAKAAPKKSPSHRAAAKAVIAPSQTPAIGPRSLAPDPATVRRAQRGRAPIEARLDLHGDRQAEAAARLCHFLKTSHALGRRCVLVITGKGDDKPSSDFFAPPKGVLRRRLPDWLAAPALRDIISGFAPAHQRHGGGGAFYVFLKKNRKS